MKIVSQLDANGYFVSPVIAYDSPLEEGVFLIPGGAVDVEPPVIPEGQRARWQGGWVFEVIPQPESEPAPEPGPPQPKRVTSLQFLDLFTESEQLAVATAAMQSAQVKLWYDRTLAASFVTLADPRTEGGLTALVGAGLLTAERKAAIVAAMS